MTSMQGVRMTSIRRFSSAIGFLICAGSATLAAGAEQAGAPQKAPFANGYPVAPIGLADQPLREGPFVYPTAEQMDVRVTVFARGLEYPYSLAFLPTGDLLFTERPGRLRIIRNGKLDPQPIAGGPASRYAGKSGAVGAVHGYMSLVVHPRFAENHWIYFSYTKPLDEKRATGAVARARLEGGTMSDVRDVFVGENIRGAVSIAMTPDGMLWIGTAGDAAQDPKSQAGKVLRLRDDGSVPQDNPFVGKEGYRPEIYTLGHRSSMGLTVHPTTNEVWLSEMGPNGGDEINVIKAGRNYGWPLVSLGRTYPGPWQAKSNQATHEGYEPPVVYWMPAISVSGLTFYTGDKLAKWKGDLFVGGVRTGEVPGTGHLDRVLFNDKMEELRRESLLGDLHQRIRDVKQGPDGLLYVATDELQGAILRIEPAK
jgi:glucose/arabinose dehydrogenase